MIRSLVNLLDEWMPYVEGSEIYDDPFNPVSKHAKDLLAVRGDKTPPHGRIDVRYEKAGDTGHLNS